MKNFALALLTALLGTGCATMAPDTIQAQVTALQVPGEQEKGHCLEYAWSLHKMLFAQSIESRLVVYIWQEDVPGHAIVLFRVGESWYLIENELDRAVQVHGETDLERVRCFAPCIRVHDASATTYAEALEETFNY